MFLMPCVFLEGKRSFNTLAGYLLVPSSFTTPERVSSLVLTQKPSSSMSAENSEVIEIKKIMEAAGYAIHHLYPNLSHDNMLR